MHSVLDFTRLLLYTAGYTRRIEKHILASTYFVCFFKSMVARELYRIYYLKV